MNVIDPIADLLTRIRNSQKAGKDICVIPASKIKIGIIHILKEEGFVKAFKCVRDNKQGYIKVALKYEDEHKTKPVIQSLKRESKCSRRKYIQRDQIPYIKNGYGLAVLSTSKGVLSCRNARKIGVGGELLCSVY